MESCKHCGDPIIHNPIVDEKNHIFCCQGCLQVNHLIGDDSDLNLYFELLDAENSSAPKVKFQQNPLLESLQNESFLKTIGSFKGNTHKVHIYSKQVHCSACSWLLEKMLNKQFDLERVRVDFVSGRMDVEYHADKVQLSEVLKYTSTLGYIFDSLKENPTHKSLAQKALLIRIAVSGSIFSNTMIFAIASYFGMFTGISDKFLNLFNWISLLLIIPCVTYCAYPFYQKAWMGLKNKVFHMDLPISIGIVVTFILSIYLIINGKHGYFDSVAGLVFFLLIGRWVVKKFERSLQLDEHWYEEIQSDRVKCLTENGIEQLEMEKLKKGDRVVVYPNEYIPIDGRLETDLTWVDKSLFSGESEPVKVQQDEMVLAGFKNLKEKVVLEVMNLDSIQRLKQMKNEFDSLVEEKVAKDLQVEKIVPYFVMGVLIIASVAFGYFYSYGLEKAMVSAASILIVSCPCALALARPISRGVCLKKLNALGFYFKDQGLLEKIMNVKTLIFDKTGTLTMTKRKISKWSWMDNSLSEGDKEFFYQKLLTLTSNSYHPVSVSIHDDVANHVNNKKEGLKSFKELVGFGLSGTFKNDQSLIICSMRSMNPALSDTIFRSCPEILNLRSVYSKKSVHDNSYDSIIFFNGKPVLKIGFVDELKEGVVTLFKKFKQQKKKVVLLSGDKEKHVKGIADKVDADAFYSEKSPEEKLAYLKKYQEEGNVLAVGDGLNDSLLVAGAEVGVVVKGGAHALANGADVLMGTPDFSKMNSLFSLCSMALKSEKVCYGVSLSYNAVAITLAFAGILNPLWAAVLMPLSSLSICLTALSIVRS